MKQSRFMSLVESGTKVAVGYGIAVVTQMMVLPVFGVETTLAQNLKLGLVFIGVSIARSYSLRRFFSGDPRGEGSMTPVPS